MGCDLTSERLMALQQRLPNVPVEELKAFMEKHPGFGANKIKDFFFADLQRKANGM